MLPGRSVKQHNASLTPQPHAAKVPQLPTPLAVNSKSKHCKIPKRNLVLSPSNVFWFTAPVVKSRIIESPVQAFQVTIDRGSGMKLTNRINCGTARVFKWHFSRIPSVPAYLSRLKERTLVVPRKQHFHCTTWSPDRQYRTGPSYLIGINVQNESSISHQATLPHRALQPKRYIALQ